MKESRSSFLNPRMGSYNAISVRYATYDHRLERFGHPVRSAIHKLQTGGLVVGWVTTSEYPLLHVFEFSHGVVETRWT